MNALQNQIQLIKGSFGPPGVKGELGDTGLPGPMVSHWFNTCTAVHFQISQLFSHRFLKKHDNTRFDAIPIKCMMHHYDMVLLNGYFNFNLLFCIVFVTTLERDTTDF